MPKFKKKPIVIEAEQFHPDVAPLPFADRRACNLGPEGWYVVTAHGHQTPIVDGDWIIPEPGGRGFYPCKPDIFESSYDPTAELQPPLEEVAERQALVDRCLRILYGTRDGFALTVQQRAEELADLIEEVRGEIPRDIDDLV